MKPLGIRVLLNRIVAIKAMMRDKSVELWKKLLIILGIVYLVWPMDMLPAMAFPLSLLDDVAVWLIIIYALRKTLDNYWFGQNVVDFSKKYNDKNIVEGVEFNVKDYAEKDSEDNKDE